MTISTRLTDQLGITHPILSAPMALAGGGALAAAVTNAGGLGLIGGGYADADWISEQFAAAGNARVGCGFITWNLMEKLDDDPDALGRVLDRKPAMLMLSFGDPAPLAADIAAASVPLACQVQTLRDAKRAADCGATLIIAQGAEAGGHGEKRATMTFVPEVADWLSLHHPDVLLCAAGGIADGRGLAAALMLGADGVLVGSRLWASEDALVHPAMLDAAVEATGDDTIRSSVMDIARHYKWPERYTARVLKNAFTDRWHNDIDGLLAVADSEAARWKAAWGEGDVTTANTFVGEATGLIADIQPAGVLVETMVREAEERLARY
ncbi:MAG: nitronate monooxygenase [Pseudomonadota bacterium]